MNKSGSRNRRNKRLTTKYRSTTHYLLSSLVPYTEANLKLAFRPSVFFDDLHKLSQSVVTKNALKASYYRAVDSGLLIHDDRGTPSLTEAGLARLRRYEPTKLSGAASILVIFDIPEQERRLRQRLRTLLRELRFTQVQKSVWQSEYDVLEYLVPELAQYHLEEYVQIYESARVV